ncbi:MAG: STM4011 family radical SAM protein [Myxococcota bacterium]
MEAITLHYRGPLTSCNYSCDYCPFAKDWEPEAVLRADREGVERFVAWAQAWDGPQLHILFTPWGEALVRKWYRDALVALSKAPSVAQVAAQTNLSMALEWLAAADRRATALWTTWHPTQVPMSRFLAQCERLDMLGVRHSVGVVGLHEHIDEIEALRAALPATTYVWVNAFQRVADYYDEAQQARLRAVDPHFETNRPHPSLGRACRAGETHFTVDGEGTLRRCHFVDEAPLGNLYAGDLPRVSRPRTCPNASCRCHIGYVHLEALQLYSLYGPGLMARIPASHDRV